MGETRRSGEGMCRLAEGGWEGAHAPESWLLLQPTGARTREFDAYYLCSPVRGAPIPRHSPSSNF